MSSRQTPRRRFLKQTIGLAGSAGVLRRITADGAPAAAIEPLPSIKLGRHQVTRLIIGGNPLYGHSHFNKLLSQYQQAWSTPERVVSLLKHCEAHGINTWQNSYTERTMSDLDRYRAAGGSMNWLCLGKPDWDSKPELIAEAARRKPIGIAPHGALAERLYRQKKLPVLVDLLKRIRDQGVLVGLSAHNPALVDLAEENHWDVDYYMCCLYYLTRPVEEFRKILGPDLPLGEIYLPSDPPRMFETIRKATKPCLAFKVLAAGRKVESPAQVEQAFQTVFNHLKPTDGIIVGMYLQLNDQVAENAAIVRRLGVSRGGSPISN